MPDFEIRISTPADLTGAQATTQAMAGVVQQAEAVAASATKAAGAESEVAQAAGRIVDAAGRLREANGRFVEMGSGAKSAAHEISEAEHEADHLINTLKMGVGIDIGHRVVEGIGEIPRAFREAIAEGVKYNAEMESLGLSLAGALRAADPSHYLNFEQARDAGVDALEKIRAKANALGLDMKALAETLSVNIPTLAEAGVKEIDKQIEVITLLNQVAASKGIQGFQATRDTIDILNGMGNRTLLGKELESSGITNESVKQAKETGQTYELFTTKLAGYAEAGAAAADTFVAAQQRMRNQVEQLYGEISRPVFTEFKAAYNELSKELSRPEVVEALKRLGFEVADIVREGAGMVEWAVRNAGVLVPLAEGIGAVALALGVLKAAQVTFAIGGMVAGWAAETFAVGKHAEALALDTAAQERNNVARAGGGEGTGLASAVAVPLAIGTVVGVAANLGIRAYSASIEEATQKSLDLGTSLDKQRATLQQQIVDADTLAKQVSARSSLEVALSVLQAKSVGLSGQDHDLANGQVQLLEAMIAHFNEIAGKRKEQAKAEKEIADQQQRQVDYAATLKEVNVHVETALDKSRFEALTPRQQLGELRGKQGAEIANFRTAYQAFGGDPTAVSDHSTPAELNDLANNSSSDETKLNLKQRVEELVALNDQISKLQDHIGKQMEKDDADAAKKADKAAQDAAKRAELIRDQSDELVITQAKVNGNDQLARLLESELKTRKEIKSLEDGGADAKTLDNARERLRLEYELNEKKIAQKQAEKDADDAEEARQDYEEKHPLERRQYESGSDYYQRTGRIDARPVDTDSGGGLHAGGLETGGLVTGTLNKKSDEVDVSNFPKVQAVQGTVNVGNWPHDGTSDGSKASKSPGLPLLPGFNDPSDQLKNPGKYAIDDPADKLAHPAKYGFGDPEKAVSVPAFTKFNSLDDFNPEKPIVGADGTNPLAPAFAGSPLNGLFGSLPTSAGGFAPTASGLIPPQPSGDASSGGKGDNGAGTALSGMTTSANSATTALNALTQAAQAVVNGLQKGDKGDKGDPGEDGEDGEDGADGQDGADGADGEGISGFGGVGEQVRNLQATVKQMWVGN